jgi:tRNA(Ile)-lysidine synthase
MLPPAHSPALMRVRAAVRPALARASDDVRDEERDGALLLVGLSGGADSLALAAAARFEAPRFGVRVGAVVVDHGLQEGSAEVASRAAEQARELGLDPVTVRRVRIEQDRVGAEGGLESAARSARYAALVQAAGELGAGWIAIAHTRDDQAEQTLLALARGSGARSLAGIPSERHLDGGALVLRPLLAERFGITRADTEAACAELGLQPWRDPHNEDPAFARVRVRSEILPALERGLGPGVAAALARSADMAREDADALDELARTALVDVLVPGAMALQAAPLADLPSALRNRVIRLAASEHLGARLSREHTLAIAALVTDWKGQGPIDVPGLTVTRVDGRLVFRARRPLM